MIFTPLSDLLKNVLARAVRLMMDGPTFDELSSALANMFPARGYDTKAANYTVTPGDNRKLFRASAAVSFALPGPADGLAFRFFQNADANLVITCAGLIIAKGNAAAGTLTFSTLSEKIGSHVMVEAVLDGTTWKWLVANLGSTTMTVGA